MSDYHTLTVPERQILQNQVEIMEALYNILNCLPIAQMARARLNKPMIETENLLAHGKEEKDEKESGK